MSVELALSSKDADELFIRIIFFSALLYILVETIGGRNARLVTAPLNQLVFNVIFTKGSITKRRVLATIHEAVIGQGTLDIQLFSTFQFSSYFI